MIYRSDVFELIILKIRGIWLVYVLDGNLRDTIYGRWYRKANSTAFSKAIRNICVAADIPNKCLCQRDLYPDRA